MLRTHKGNMSFRRRKKIFVTAFKCLKQIKWLRLTCTPIYELPSNISTMVIITYIPGYRGADRSKTSLEEKRQIFKYPVNITTRYRFCRSISGPALLVNAYGGLTPPYRYMYTQPPWSYPLHFIFRRGRIESATRTLLIETLYDELIIYKTFVRYMSTTCWKLKFLVLYILSVLIKRGRSMVSGRRE